MLESKVTKSEEFKEVNKFKYMGLLISEAGETEMGVLWVLGEGVTMMGGLDCLWRSRGISIAKNGV